MIESPRALMCARDRVSARSTNVLFGGIRLLNIKYYIIRVNFGFIKWAIYLSLSLVFLHFLYGLHCTRFFFLIQNNVNRTRFSNPFYVRDPNAGLLFRQRIVNTSVKKEKYVYLSVLLFTYIDICRIRFG